MNVVVLDPAVENVNAGDSVISQAIRDLPGLGVDDVDRLTTHRPLRLSERRVVSNADIVILGGSNAISSHMERFRQWLVDPDLFFRMRGKFVLLGVGWWQYQEPPCGYTRILLRQLSSRRFPHSVRDQYTSDRLAQLGLRNHMTGCPTMWSLDGVQQRALGESSTAVITVTDYKESIETDRAWIREVFNRYESVISIGMGPGDQDYFDRLAIAGLEWGGTGTQALNQALTGSDFIGTRLHAGIRAIQMGRPSIVLSVDNRAQEISRDTGLRVVPRNDVHALKSEADVRNSPDIAMPTGAIRSWSDAMRAALE